MFQISFHEGMQAALHTQFYLQLEWERKKKSVKLLQDLKRMIWNVPTPLKKERGKTRKTEKIPVFWKLKIQIFMQFEQVSFFNIYRKFWQIIQALLIM